MTREELFEAVWTEPMITISSRYGVSGSYLARVCDSLNVPRPDRGYWAKKAVGKAPPTPELPMARSGEPTSWSSGDGILIRRSTSRPRPEPSSTRKGSAGRVRTHALIQGASAHFLKSRTTGKYAYLKPFKYHLVDITVSEAGLTHALEFGNALFLAMEEKGHHVFLQSNVSGHHSRPSVDPLDEQRKRPDRNPHYNLWAPGRLTIADVSGQQIGLAIVEVAKETVMRYVGNSTYIPDSQYRPKDVPFQYRGDNSWTTTREIPIGLLSLIAYSPHARVTLVEQWQETGKTSLAKRIPEIIAGIENMTTVLPALISDANRKMEAEVREWEEAHRRREIEDDRRRIHSSRKESSEQLDALIQHWALIRSRSDFLASLEAEVPGLPEPERGLLLQRLTLARELLGPLDPMPHFLQWRSPEDRYEPKNSDDFE